MYVSIKHTLKSATIKEWNGQRGDIVISDAGKKYVIDRKLGAGGFADVYLATAKSGDRFALKLLRMWSVSAEERREVQHRFEREYKCSQIASEFLVHTFDKGMQFGNPFFLMEYCPNGNLGDWVGNTLSEKEYRRVAVRILKGLNDLHKQGIIHRDLKPVNILFDENNEVLLTDFGISGYLQSRITIRDWLGHVKQIFGTVVYMPPEQLNAREAFLSLGPVTDMFAFGVMMHELICKGQLPYGSYEESNESEFLERLVGGKYHVFDSTRKKMPTLWGEIIERCIQPNPEKRAQSPLEILQLLDTQAAAPVDDHPMASPRKYVLRIMQGVEHGKAYDLWGLKRKHKTNILTLGWYDADQPNRNHINIVEMITKFISKHHATLEFDADDEIWYIRDGQWRSVNNVATWLPSTNGVLVNSSRITENGFALCAGDIITVGDTTLRMDAL
ncbi:FHA domain-containing serine/threonine-protein kinase [Chryseolinea sp. T2]|uniref:FHA domain-containing serine/threonine-protein kinase n=1 Tax=Chryseolinea sp. T2 TaxID=3129255 RepID=UPI003078502C